MTAMIHIGDCRAILATLPAQSVQTCVTSPPYFGLRDYGTASWDGGDLDCDHLMPPMGGTRKSGLNAKRGDDGFLADDRKSQLNLQPFRDVCGKCGATRTDRQIGLERTVEDYVGQMVAVFREVHRVLKDDGTLWLNLGSSYGPNKQLIPVPWLVALALQQDGWTLRSDIIWSKPNPLPESVTDRPTKAHEYIFLLTKSPRYYYDSKAIAEQSDPRQHEHNQRYARPYDNNERIAGGQPGNVNHVGIHSRPGDGTRNKRSVWTVATQPFSDAHFATFPPKLIEPCILAGSREGDVVLDPFAGAGTSGLVADRLGRDSVLIELNPDYAAMMRARIYNDAPLFAALEAHS